MPENKNHVQLQRSLGLYSALSLVIGTIIGVVFLKGVAAGPVIAAGITYYLVTLLNLSFS